MTVWKYPFKLDTVISIEMPVGAEVLHVAVQHGQPCLWARVNEEAEVETRNFAITGTGHMAPSRTEARHVGTFLMDGGNYVWHMFEEVVF